MPENTLRIVTQDSIHPSQGRKDPVGLAGGYWDDDCYTLKLKPKPQGE